MISNCMTSFLLTLSGIVLLIQVGLTENRLNVIISILLAFNLWQLLGSSSGSKSLLWHSGPGEWYTICSILSVYIQESEDQHVNSYNPV